ncbi:hypothetical protein BDV35DRAFT_353680 [Aspergillus flavus]|uniref:Uncharacterized protein n=1 Tax=Aspergillus flavus TaxID=5059 RepID=A0A5N6H037_ASPFL|nr:hypothetical protein BDV35DRAFT_353680 [Aspergillus flavus]
MLIIDAVLSYQMILLVDFLLLAVLSKQSDGIFGFFQCYYESLFSLRNCNMSLGMMPRQQISMYMLQNEGHGVVISVISLQGSPNNVPASDVEFQP